MAAFLYSAYCAQRSAVDDASYAHLVVLFLLEKILEEPNSEFRQNVCAKEGKQTIQKFIFSKRVLRHFNLSLEWFLLIYEKIE